MTAYRVVSSLLQSELTGAMRPAQGRDGVYPGPAEARRPDQAVPGGWRPHQTHRRR